jgi:hypothetical protein
LKTVPKAIQCRQLSAVSARRSRTTARAWPQPWAWRLEDVATRAGVTGLAIAHRSRRVWRQTLGPVHHAPLDFSDRFALAATRLMRALADLFFAQRYGHRAVVLETVAAVPGMVGATATHLQSLRRMVDDDGWIRTLMDEAEMRDVVCVVRADEAHHRDVNHGFATQLAAGR